MAKINFLANITFKFPKISATIKKNYHSIPFLELFNSGISTDWIENFRHAQNLHSLTQTEVLSFT